MQPGPQVPYGGSAPPASKFPVWIIILLVVVGLGVVGIGVFAALGIYGTRRYLASAKTSEAKNTIGAIAQTGVDVISVGALTHSVRAHDLGLDVVVDSP